MKSLPFTFDVCHGHIMYHSREEFTIDAQIEENVRHAKIAYRAANPIDKRSSFSGSGLPFANYTMAFENTPNEGEVELSLQNKFSLDLLMPNSYYTSLGTVLIPPTVFIEYNNGTKNKIIPIRVNNPVPYRTLTYPISTSHISRQDPTFYSVMQHLPVRTQEQILRDSGFPETFNPSPIHVSTPVNFWGLKPPV